MNVIVDYGVGNLLSLTNAVKYLGFEVTVSREPEIISGASRLILPGVGAFQTGMQNIAKNGLTNLILSHVQKAKPLLGICLGFQLLTKSSDEFGYHQGLGVLRAECRRLSPIEKVPLPHMGWNTAYSVKSTSGIDGLINGKAFYFVHSHGVKALEEGGEHYYTSYGSEKFIAAIKTGNILGVQFHPEKSGNAGLDLLNYFLRSEIL